MHFKSSSHHMTHHLSESFSCQLHILCWGISIIQPCNRLVMKYYIVNAVFSQNGSCGIKRDSLGYSVSKCWNNYDIYSTVYIYIYNDSFK